MTEAWVLYWKYNDNSNFKLVRVYLNEERARLDFELVNDEQDRMWALEKVDCLSAYNPSTLRSA